MTTAEFMALAPRERDAVVAERVLGWVWVKLSPHLYAGRPELVQARRLRPAGQYSCFVPADGSELIDSNYAYEYVRNLTTNRVDMWEVIDAMRERGFHCQLSVGADGSTKAMFTDMKGAATAGERYIRLQDTEHMYRFVYALEGNELPLAASIAALRAVGWVVD
jgi:hypothetical protein